MLDTTLSRAETAEPIEMPFGLWTRVQGPGWGPDPPRGRGNFGGCSPIENVLPKMATQTSHFRRCRCNNAFSMGTTPKIAPSPGAPTDSVWSQQYRGPTGVVIVRRLYMCIYAKKDFETTNCTDGCMQTITMDDVTDPRH